MDRTCRACGGNNNYRSDENIRWEDIHLDTHAPYGSKDNIKMYNWRYWTTGWNRAENEHSGHKSGMEFLARIDNYQLPKMNCIPWYQLPFLTRPASLAPAHLGSLHDSSACKLRKLRASVLCHLLSCY